MSFWCFHFSLFPVFTVANTRVWSHCIAIHNGLKMLASIRKLICSETYDSDGLDNLETSFNSSPFPMVHSINLMTWKISDTWQNWDFNSAESPLDPSTNCYIHMHSNLTLKSTVNTWEYKKPLVLKHGTYSVLNYWCINTKQYFNTAGGLQGVFQTLLGY